MRKMGLRTTKLGYLKSVLQEIHFMTFIHNGLKYAIFNYNNEIYNLPNEETAHEI